MKLLNEKPPVQLRQDLMSRVAETLRNKDWESAKGVWGQLIQLQAKSTPTLDRAGINRLIWQALSNAGLVNEMKEGRDLIRDLEDKLNHVGDDAQLANVDLQNILQKQQQTLQMMSNISKMFYDTAVAVIRKIDG